MRIMSGMLPISAHSLEIRTACCLHWISWKLVGPAAFPACNAPLRHWKITLSSPFSQGIKAAALLSQNQTPCCSDSTRLWLISPRVSFYLLTRITGRQKSTWQKKVDFFIWSIFLPSFNPTKRPKSCFSLWRSFFFVKTNSENVLSTQKVSVQEHDAQNHLYPCAALQKSGLCPIIITLLTFFVWIFLQSANLSISKHFSVLMVSPHSLCVVWSIHHPGMTH